MTKNILITGASRGIGRAAAVAAGRLGWSVGINYAVNEMAARETADAVEEAGGKSLLLHGDVADESAVTAMFAKAADAFGGLDGAVLNAGIVAPASRLTAMSSERLRRLFDVNVLGTFLTAREAARHLSRDSGGRGGAIVIVSSAASRLGAPDEYVDYAASKGAADSLTIGLSKELGPAGVRVNAIRPAFIDTEIHASGGRPDRARVFGEKTPLGRAGEPEEVAEAIIWLLGDASSYVTGTFMEMSGGG